MSFDSLDALTLDCVACADVGENPRNSSTGRKLYQQLRDARSAARAQERKAESGELGAIDFRLPAEWAEVRTLSIRILADVGKDVEIMTWLTEAETRLNGHAGLSRSADLITRLVNEYGLSLHPQPEDADDKPFATLAGLNGIGREGTLIQTLRLLPLVPGKAHGECTLWNVIIDKDVEKIALEMSTAGMLAMRTHHSTVLSAISSVLACDEALTKLLGNGAPPFAQISDVLDDTERAIRRLAGPLLEDTRQEATVIQPTPDARATAQATSSTGFTSREQALVELMRIAEHFKQTEPQSPIGQSLETLVRRARMDFVSLIAELLPDDQARDALMKSAGIGKRNDGAT